MGRRNQKTVDETMILYRNLDKLTEDDLKAIKAEKPNIIAILAEEAAQRKKAAEERQSKIDAIEGLAELEEELENYQHKNFFYSQSFSLFFYDNWREDGFDPNDYPSTSKLLELKEKYPRAIAYLYAKNHSNSSDFLYAGRGRKAMEQILNGEDYEMAIAEMDRGDLLDNLFPCTSKKF